MDDLREVIARAFWGATSDQYNTFGTLDEDEKDELFRAADAALAAIKAAGCVVVPAEPTERMVRQGADAIDGADAGMLPQETQAEDCYRAMIEASNAPT